MKYVLAETQAVDPSAPTVAELNAAIRVGCPHTAWYTLDELLPGPTEHGCLECGLTWITVD